MNRVGFLGLCVLTAGVLAAAACKKGAPVSHASPLVAEVQGEVITLADLDQAIRGDLYRLRAESLHQLVSIKLEQAEARRRDISVKELREREVDSKVPQPTEDDLRSVVEQARQEGLPEGVTEDQIRKRVISFLTTPKRREVKEDYIDRLYAGAKVRLDLNTLGRPKVPVRDSGPSVGPTDAAVTIVEYTDFHSEFARMGNETLKRVIEAYPHEVRILFRQKPEDGDPAAALAAEAALCADGQGRYWDYRQALMSKPGKFDEAELTSRASAIGLSGEAFAGCLSSHSQRAQVEADVKEARRFGLGGTPAFLLNETPLSGAHEFRMFRRLIDVELGFSSAPSAHQATKVSARDG